MNMVEKERTSAREALIQIHMRDTYTVAVAETDKCTYMVPEYIITYRMLNILCVCVCDSIFLLLLLL